MKKNSALEIDLQSHFSPPAPRTCSGTARWGFPAAALSLTLTTVLALANGGPFVVKYPGGDPAAKGVLARLDPGLEPALESRLAVTRENLSIRFEPEQFAMAASKGTVDLTPLVAVTAEYFITNNTPESVEVDFGFPILRGIYISPFSMMPMPDAQVRVDGTNYLRPALISNSAIYGILRRRAAQAIEQALAADARLERLFRSCHAASPESQGSARKALTNHLVEARKWSPGDATLLAEYAALQPARNSGGATPSGSPPPGAGFFWWDNDTTLMAAKSETAWAVRAIGEQKTTQWLARLAGLFDPESASSYERIFQSWGGDVRERSVDLASGKLRPREITLEKAAPAPGYRSTLLAQADPTVYARVDYFSDNPAFTEAQKASWNTVLKHLPVVFTFAPMNLLHYRVAFVPGAARTVTVSYRQYACLDTRNPRSYQIAYVIHPASLWNSFGPIHLTVAAPASVTPVASVALHESAEAAPAAQQNYPGQPRLSYGARVATLNEKTGELFVGIDAGEWAKAMPAPATVQPAAKATAQR